MFRKPKLSPNILCLEPRRFLNLRICILPEKPKQQMCWLRENKYVQSREIFPRLYSSARVHLQKLIRFVPSFKLPMILVTKIGTNHKYYSDTSLISTYDEFFSFNSMNEHCITALIEMLCSCITAQLEMIFSTVHISSQMMNN